ncbi:hypothetical protein [Paenibacillus macerans]|uniref:hypothetical protein n=1 Tax=Paenibacillus macerans TaxID=44252 RepID=UPI003D31CCCA
MAKGGVNGMRIAAYCDFYGDASRPLQLIVHVRPGEPDWSGTLYVPVTGPFEPFAPEDFGDLQGVSVLLEDLMQRKKPPGPSGGSERMDGFDFEDPRPHIGINLARIAARHGEPGDIQLLVVQMDDVEEALRYERN